jgi:DNA invertase Pin-like site-specific DNA recombinase
MMIAAIYTRLSRDDGGRDASLKSVTIQADDCRAFAAKNGWTVGETYCDDGVSGAIFGEGRPDFTRLLADVTRPVSKKARKTWRPPFDILLVTEQSRLGRDATLTQYAILQIENAGIKVYEARSGQQITTDGTGAIISSVQGFVSQQERRKIAERQRPAKRRRAEQGLVAGGKTFGYTNVRDAAGAVRYAINEREAAVVRRVFEMVAAGHGYAGIAKLLGDDGSPSPRNLGWSATGIRKVIERDLYRGQIVYGKTRVEWPVRGEDSIQVPVPEKDWLRRDLPEARIVTDALWKAAHDRIARTRKAFASHRAGDGKLQGRPESALVREHLLSGFLRCGVCGGNLFLLVSKAGKNSPSKRFYVCTTNFKRGVSRCANNVRLPYEDITTGVIEAFESRISDREVIEKFLFAEREASSVEAVAQERAILEADLAALDREIKRLIALADGDNDLEELKVRLGTRKAARSEKVARLEALTSRQDGDSPAVVFATWFREWLQSTSPEAFWDAPTKAPVAQMIGSDIPEARQALRGFLAGGSIVVTPEQTETGATVSFKTEGDLGALLGWLAVQSRKASTAYTSPG